MHAASQKAHAESFGAVYLCARLLQPDGIMPQVQSIFSSSHQKNMIQPLHAVWVMMFA